MDNIVEVEILSYGDSDLSSDGSIKSNGDDNFCPFKKAKHSFENLDQDTLLDKTSFPNNGITAPFGGNECIVEEMVDYSDSNTTKDICPNEIVPVDAKKNYKVDNIDECSDPGTNTDKAYCINEITAPFHGYKDNVEPIDYSTSGSNKTKTCPAEMTPLINNKIENSVGNSDSGTNKEKPSCVVGITAPFDEKNYNVENIVYSVADSNKATVCPDVLIAPTDGKKVENSIDCSDSGTNRKTACAGGTNSPLEETNCIVKDISGASVSGTTNNKTCPNEITAIFEENQSAVEDIFDSSDSDSDIVEKKTFPDGITIPYAGNKYVVEDILDFSDLGTNADKYLIKWKGWDSSYNSWEPLENLSGCRELLMEFFRRRKYEWETILENSTYIRMSDGKLRRQGPRLAVPTDPRPLSEIVDEFANLQRRTLNNTEKDVAELQFFKAVRKNKTFLWDEKKIKRYLDKGFDGQLDENMNTDLQTQLFYLHLKEKREWTLGELKDWQIRLNRITRGKPKIIIENEADFALPPQDFIYSNFYVPGEGVVIPNDPPLGCSCTKTGNCWTNREKCCPSGFGADNGYTKTKRYLNEVKEGVGIPLYECNKACKCDSQCSNRVVQDGYSTIQGSIMKIFRTFNGCGWGVKTMKAIPKGTFVGLYIGEVITTEEADKRGKKYDADGRTYLFDLDFNSPANPFTVDAKTYGNFTHFINHSCDANLGVYSVWVNCLDPNLPMLALFSLRDISKNEEITMNYSNDLDIRKRKNESGRQVCLCGTRKCRGFIF